jgi:hypothetical protein
LLIDVLDYLCVLCGSIIEFVSLGALGGSIIVFAFLCVLRVLCVEAFLR